MLLAAGTTLGPYTIVEPIGAGGMGQVYRARDSRLGRDVAVKILPPSIAADPGYLKRFEQEARAAGALNHPNIVAVHDVGVHDGSPFLVMELLEGDNLRQRLARGPLSSRQALAVALQAADGLGAAHARGIVHRDLKPENLFLLPDDRVKILDFGLAKLMRPIAPPSQGEDQPSQTPTEPGIVLGTAGYMAPEQVRGHPADHRTDLFSLGVILYEMLAGRRAFRGDSFVDIAFAICNTEPPPLAERAQDLPAGVDRLVRRCLAKDPETRIDSATELATELRGLLHGGRDQRARRDPARAHARWRRRGALGVAAALLVAAAAVLLRSRDGAEEPAVALEPKRVVVAVFENRTGDGALDPLARMTSDWITQGLSRVEGLDAVPSTSVLMAQAGRPGAQQTGRDPLVALAQETAAGTVVSGEYYLQGDRLAFQCRITNGRNGKLLFAMDPKIGERNDPLASIDALRQEVMGALAAKLLAAHDLGVRQQPPRYEAYREFVAGFELFLSDDAAALRHLERAVELDSTFHAPLFYAAYIHEQAGDHARVEEILFTLSSNRQHLSLFARHWLDTMSAYFEHRWPAALQSILAARSTAPRDPLTAQWAGFLAVKNNRPLTAVAVHDTLGAVPFAGHRLGLNYVVYLCAALHLLGRHERELTEAQGIRRNFPEEPMALSLEASALAALGRLDEVKRVARESLTSASKRATAGDVVIRAASELRAHGYRQASLELAAQAVDWYAERLESHPSSRPEWLEGMVHALQLSERWDEAAAACRSLLQADPGDVAHLGTLGALAARRGRRDEALSISEQLRRINQPRLHGENTYQRACIAAQLGDKELALALLREAFAEGVPYGVGHHREIGLEPLWDDASLRALLAPKE